MSMTPKTSSKLELANSVLSAANKDENAFAQGVETDDSSTEGKKIGQFGSLFKQMWDEKKNPDDWHNIPPAVKTSIEMLVDFQHLCDAQIQKLIHTDKKNAYWNTEQASRIRGELKQKYDDIVQRLDQKEGALANKIEEHHKEAGNKFKFVEE